MAAREEELLRIALHRASLAKLPNKWMWLVTETHKSAYQQGRSGVQSSIIEALGINDLVADAIFMEKEVD